MQLNELKVTVIMTAIGQLVDVQADDIRDTDMWTETRAMRQVEQHV